MRQTISITYTGLEASDSEASVAAPALSSRSKLSMFISTIKSQIQEQEIMFQREHGANPATSMFGEDSSEGSSQSESTDLGSWESGEGVSGTVIGMSLKPFRSDAENCTRSPDVLYVSCLHRVEQYNEATGIRHHMHQG